MMIYVASPYTSDEEHIRNARYGIVLHYVRNRMLTGEVLFSPIVYGHQFVAGNSAVVPASFWRNFNFHMLRNSNSMRVLRMPGWYNSAGIAEEIEYCVKYRIPVEWVNPL